jgi:hypothetical protein
MRIETKSLNFFSNPNFEQPRCWPRLDAVDDCKVEKIGLGQLTAVYLISVDAKTEAFQPCNLCEVSVEHHVKNTFVNGALPDAARRVVQTICERRGRLDGEIAL